ncbi:C6 transcription factor [Lasiodiplodia theobromae]|uniref:C6 transcription factor n=1 Tax=Lasiodiplodia theobromae TaxID=45133 RepID=UPI0015C2CD80|nr:C6 transcription factor [Lasiodiplodia theobromae]KAF4539142.1 C6 transcription factor [Lasiodiplodia theobromae]
MSPPSPPTTSSAGPATSTSNQPSPASGSGSTGPVRRRPRRNYQACLACKEQKIRCQLGSPDDPQPPCARCRRSRLDCVFGPPRTGGVGGRGTRRRGRTRGGGGDDEAADSGHPLGPRGGDPVPSDVPSVGVHASAAAGEAAAAANGSAAVPGDDGQARPMPGRQQQPTAAANAATASSTSTATFREYHTASSAGRSPWDAAAISGTLRSRDLSPWAQFPLCRDGWMSPQEAEFLLQCYFDRMQPLYPVVDETYQDSERRHVLVVNEPVLCTAILTVTSRYAWLDGTPASSRAHEIHSLLFKQAQQSIHQSLWGVENDVGRESRMLSIIESILLLVEWRPRPLDVMPNQGMVAGTAYMFGVDAGDPGTAQNSVIDDETHKAYMLARRINATSWRLLGHAVNLADEISLVEGLSRSREPNPRPPANIRRRARVRDLLIPLTWEVSFRLGRSSFLKLPTPTASAAEEYTDESVYAALLNTRAELYRLARLVENTLYASVSATKDIIASDRHPEMVASLVEIFGDWWNKFQRVGGPFAFRKTLEIQYHNVWTYMHAIFFQAIIERLRGFSTREPDIRHFERSYRPQGLSIAEVLRSERSRRDLQMTEEIAKASVQVLELVLDLEREGYLGFLPFTTMTWVFTSATLLLKGTGLRASAADLGTTDLLKRASRSLDRAVVDDVHAMSHHTSSLMSLIHKVQSGPPATGAATTTSTSRPTAQSGDSVNRAADATGAPQPVPDAATSAAANLPPMDVANSGAGEAPTQEQGMFAGSATAAAGGSGGGLFDPMFNADALAEDWANWLSVGLDGMDGGSFGFDFYPGAGSGDFSAPW